MHRVHAIGRSLAGAAKLIVPLRDFSYPGTQLKGLGSSDFNHLPINAPRCPFHHFQQDGHTAMHNPRDRADDEPNSWGGAREAAQGGIRAYPASYGGEKARMRSAAFAYGIFRNQAGITFHPPVERCMIDRDSALGHDLLEVATR